MKATIAAIASAPGGARRGVIRISGARAADIVRACCRVDGAPPTLAERLFFEARFDDGHGEQPALLLWMPGPRSFTREDVAELHLSGSPPLLACALARTLELGAEPAAPGEFTRRAFESGRIDLTRAEGVLALIEASSEHERRAATALLVGGLDGRIAALREGLDGLRALCEASLDFDESDTGHVPTGELAAGARAVEEGLAEALTWEDRRAQQSGLPRIVLAGLPNAGKSALFNRLTGAEHAEQSIVSGLAGTTRDARAADWVVGGIACRLVDTAGDDPRADPRADWGADRAAQERTGEERSAADVLLWVVDASAPPADAPAAAEPRRSVLVWNKIDLARDAAPSARLLAAAHEHVAVSAATGTGLADLGLAAARALGVAGGAAPSGLGRELHARHKACLAEAHRQLGEARANLDAGAPLDLYAESLRAATASLDRITGRTTPDDLLDRIFSRFCIGK
ncbi:MAG: GTP-binding protein [bacterium]|nr:GTP-binding protein [bacterium]